MRLFILIIILSGLAGLLFFLNPGIFSIPLEVSLALSSASPKDLGEATSNGTNSTVISKPVQDFTPNEKPIPVKWRGEIFALVESGNGFAVKKIPEDKDNPYVLANFRDPEKREDIQGEVLITGTWEGVDCSAYQKTVFYDHCAQYVLIDKIEKLK